MNISTFQISKLNAFTPHFIPFSTLLKEIAPQLWLGRSKRVLFTDNGLWDGLL